MLRPILLLIITTMSIAVYPQKYVVLEVKNNFIDVENGKPFKFLIEVRPSSGIHVNAQPPISVKPCDSAAKVSVKEPPKSGEYLDLSNPIEVECNVTGLDAGSHELGFVVGYTFCSNKEGWCRMSKDTVSVVVRVKK
ncbi:MAG TPA: hypothetical protein VLX91_00175 [Candidatus Acidoferrales bacterium]|nr:hypothetical protein [Candidatus Acidoferrales bacterium]